MYKFKNIFGEDPRTLRLKVSEGGKATFYAVREGSVQHRGRREGRGGGGRVWCSENLSTLQLKFLVAPLAAIGSSEHLMSLIFNLVYLLFYKNMIYPY